MNKFSKLGLSDSSLEILNQLGFTDPTPIQEEAIPLLLTKDPTDFIGLAQTGTGKTLAFGLPLLDLIDADNKSTQALIMAPTRELGQQTAKQIQDFSKNRRNINVEVVYGGAAIVNQIKALKKPTQIVVATPGRLLDLIKRKAVKLDQVRFVILDEADEMLNMGFKEDIDKILSHTKDERSTWLFSATMPKEIRRIVNKYMVDPVEVSVNSDEKSNKDISHKYVVTTGNNKMAAIKRFMDIQPDMRGIMFCRTKATTQQIANDLGAQGYGVEALHGDLSQAQRDAVMKRFKNRSMQMLIATDVAARGIDVNDLTHVLHHLLPDQLESYTHRSGRTGRAGKKGVSLAFINPRETRKISEIEKKIQVKFEKIEVPTLTDIKSSRINNWANLIINTKVDEQANEIVEQLHGQFADMSKEELLKRLITTQLDQLSVENGHVDDLNESVKSNRSERPQGNSKFHRYFINVGMIDGVTKADLLHFISDASGVKRNKFGDITLQKNCAFIDIEADQDNGFAEAFAGTEVDGRSIRVNREEDPKPKPEQRDRGDRGGFNKHSGGGTPRNRQNYRKARRGARR